jgi:membrane protein YqaA with SNARE-associated domain
MIPFAGPSNMVIAATAGYPLGNNAGISVFLVIGVITALGATLAKSIHYGITFFISQHLNDKNNTTSIWQRPQRFIHKYFSNKKHATLDANTAKIKKWAFLSIYLAAATPIPDEPIVITLGLMKYSIAKFCVSFFLGKLTIAVLGAFLGNVMGNTLSEHISSNMMIVMSTALTIIMMIVLLKVDLGKVMNRLRGKKVDDENADFGKN